MAEFKALTAACFCGRHAFTTSVPKKSLPLEALVCHCFGCRHLTGTLGILMMDWPTEPFPDMSALSRYDFSPRVWTYFCGTCGTYLFWHKHGQGETSTNPSNASPQPVLGLTVGTINDPDEFTSVGDHICVAGTRDGGWADFLPVVNNKPLARWKGLRQDNPKTLNELLPLGWRLEPKREEHQRDDLLYCHCLCKGVEFCITRPSTVKVPGVDEGQEWWRVSNDRFPAGICVCDSCRLAAGSDVMHWSYVPKANIKLMDGSDFTGSPFGTLKSYRSSNEASRDFCSGCGATVFYISDDRAELLDVAVGLFSASGGARAEEWLSWRTYRISWEDDAKHKKLRDAVMTGLKSWGERQPAGSFQGMGKEVSYNGFVKLLAATGARR